MAVAAISVVAFVINSLITSSKTEKTQELALKAQQQNLDTRQAQLFMGFYDKLSSSEFNVNLLAIQDWKVESLDDFMKMWTDVEKNRVWSSVFGVYEGIGVLVHEGLIDVRIVARYVGRMRYDWEQWGPFILEARVLRKRPRMYIETEYLYERLMEFGRRNPDYHIV